MAMSDGFLERLAEVQQRIETAARRSGRRAADVTLLAVTKTHPAEAVLAAYAAGLRDFGENRAEGLKERHELGLADARWHMIGHIQSRKVKALVGWVNVVHSVDRLSVAEELSKRLTSPDLRNEKRETGNGKTATQPLAPSQEGGDGTSPPYPPLRDKEGEHGIDILLQVNVSGEESKGGWRVTTEQELDNFRKEVKQVVTLPGVWVRGLMTMAPYYENSEMTRPIFANLRRVQEEIQPLFPNADFGWLSMGMTNDYEIAIEEGATHVRIGTALFGERP
jgi:uncharacterized pyridoxal phosphate-containing UPF0001 family protein